MQYFLKIFEWKTALAFMQSLLPSIKLNITLPIVLTSTVIAIVSELMGVQFQTIVAIFVALFAELVTGVYASIKRGESIRSGKFGRFVVKAFVWLLSIFIVNAFCKELSSNPKAFTAYVMLWIHDMFLLTCFLEYMISINENMESITGKKSLLIRLFTHKVKELIKAAPIDKTVTDVTAINTLNLNTTEKP